MRLRATLGKSDTLHMIEVSHDGKRLAFCGRMVSSENLKIVSMLPATRDNITCKKCLIYFERGGR
jgi:hypothetical protein